MIHKGWKLAVLALIATSAAQNAQAQNWRAGVNLLGGITTTDDVSQSPVQTNLDDSTDSGGLSGGGGVSLGYDLGGYDLPFSIELASNYRHRHDLGIGYDFGGGRPDAKLDVSTLDTMLSVFWHIPTGTRYTPYLGAGAGMVYWNADTQTVFGLSTQDNGSNDGWNAAWQLQGGVAYNLSQSWDLRVDYRYIDLGTVTSAVTSLDGSVFEADLASHDFRFGAVYKF